MLRDPLNARSVSRGERWREWLGLWLLAIGSSSSFSGCSECLLYARLWACVAALVTATLTCLLAGGPVHVCRLRDRRREQHPGCPEGLRVLGLVQHPPLPPEYPPHGHQQHCAGTGETGGVSGKGLGGNEPKGHESPLDAAACVWLVPLCSGRGDGDGGPDLVLLLVLL